MKNWRTESALACSIISLLVCGVAVAQAPAKTPALAVIDAKDSAHWQAVAQEAGWQTIVPAGASTDPLDTRALAVAAAVRSAIQNSGVDPARVYLAGRGDSAAAVFYVISRLPDLFAAGLAIGGSPQAALATGRIYTVNFNNSPVLWVTDKDADEATAQKLKAAGMWMEWRSASEMKNADVFAWLAARTRDPFPLDVDCETDSPTFASCFWLTPGTFNVNELNDVLPRTLVATATPGALDLGAFGYKPDDPGPGVPISRLPEKYSGPLKLGDRITAIDGHPIADAHEFQDLMTKATEERRVVIMLQRGKERTRLETRILVPHHDFVPTARVQGRYEPGQKQILISSRSVTEMRVEIPPAWAGASLFWNGLALEKIDKPGCVLLMIDKELLHAGPCR
ncbi:MAG: PDZ domain-containing protein [Bryobacteraceae bacterium]